MNEPEYPRHGFRPPGPEPFRRPKPGLDARFEAAVVQGEFRAEGVRLLPERLCLAAQEVLDVDAAAISVFLIGESCFPVAATDEDATLAETLQFSLGEGPCLQPSALQVLIPDLHQAESAAVRAWPMYAAEMTRCTPFRTLIAFPLQVSGPPLGWLTLYRRSVTTPLGARDGSVVAALVTEQLLGAGRFTRHRLERGRRWLEAPAGRRRAQVRRAQGMIMQLNAINSADALAVLRARAFGSGRLLDDLSEDIVAGRLPVPVLEWRP